MSENDTAGVGIALDDLKASRLRDVAYSAGIDTEGTTKKAELIERLTEENVRLTDEGWKRGDESFQVEERPSGTGPSDKTALYAFKRAATTEDLLDRLEQALEDTDYVVREGETEGGKEMWSVVLPAEAQGDTKDVDDESTYTCAGETADCEPCTRSVPSKGDFCHQHRDGEE